MKKKSKISIDGLKFGFFKKILRFVLSLKKKVKLLRFCILLAKLKGCDSIFVNTFIYDTQMINIIKCD